MKLTLALFIILGLTLNLAYAGDRKCRALSLSGGGDLGAYEAGAFIELNNLLSPEEIGYDVISGVSAGSMNAAGLGLFAPLEGAEAAEFVFALWNSLSIDNILGTWPEGIFAGLYEKGGLLSTVPLVNFVTTQTSGLTVKRKVSFGTTDMDNGDYYVLDFDTSETMPDDYIMSAVASSSIPLVFDPVYKDGLNLADGGGLWNNNLQAAVRRCKEIVDDDEDIIIDIFLCSQLNDLGKKVDVSKYSALDHYLRGQLIGGLYDTLDRLESGMSFFPNINFRYIIAPTEKLLQPDNPIPLLFGKKHTERCFRVAEKDVKNAVEMGPGVGFEVIKEFTEKYRNGEDVDYLEMIQKRISDKHTKEAKL